MYINGIARTGNISFGYNESLNEQLKKRLEMESEKPLANAIGSMNTTCNNLEDSIRALISSGYDKKETYINCLVKCFMDYKADLCRAVERFFPELCYTKKEADAYESESQGDYEKPYTHELEEGTASYNVYDLPENKWKRYLAERLAKVAEEATAFKEIGNIGAVINNGADYGCSCDNDYGNYKDVPRLGKNSKVKSKKSLVEKFVPLSDSPKSIDEVVGLDKTVQEIKEFVIRFINNPEETKEKMKRYGIESPHFITFYGPPGCGKTMLAEAIAAETGADMYMLNITDVGSEFVNVTPRKIKEVLEGIAADAKKSNKPAFVFMDEMDSLFAQRRYDSSSSQEDNKAVNTLLPMIRKVTEENNIILIGATNMYSAIDAAGKRRMNFKYYIGLPNKDDIEKFLTKLLNKYETGKDFASNKEAVKEISRELVGYSPAEIINILNDVNKICYIEDRGIRKEDITNVIENGTHEKINESYYLHGGLKITGFK